jgi:hypothetical protein
MSASAGTKCATAAALSLALTAANQESVACSGVPYDAVETVAVTPGEPASAVLAGAVLAGAVLAGAADEGDDDGPWPTEVDAVHEQAAQATRPAAKAAPALRTACPVTPLVKHGR